MGWMKGMISIDASVKVAARRPLRLLLLIAAVIGTLLIAYSSVYVLLRKQGLVTDETQHDSPFPSAVWEKTLNWLAKPGYAIELQWRFMRMPDRWQRCIDAGLCPDGEPHYDDSWAQFWYREGYLEAIPAVMKSAICGYVLFMTPGFCAPHQSYRQGSVDGQRIVQAVIRRHMEEYGIDGSFRERIQPPSSIEDIGSGWIQMEGSAVEHAQFQSALNALRIRFGLAPR